MNPDEIQVVTDPKDVAQLVDPMGVDPVFAATLKEMEADKARKAQQQAAQPKTESKPVQLVYKYEGNCEKCGRLPATLMIDNEAGYFAVAYCTTDNIQLKSTKVVKLEVEKIIMPKAEPIDEAELMRKEIENQPIVKHGKQIAKEDWKNI